MPLVSQNTWCRYFTLYQDNLAVKYLEMDSLLSTLKRSIKISRGGFQFTSQVGSGNLARFSQEEENAGVSTQFNGQEELLELSFAEVFH